MYEFKNVASPPQGPAPCQIGRRLSNRDRRLLLLDDNQLDAWQERMAICTVDGGLSDVEAEAIAWREIEGRQVRPVDAHVGPGSTSAAENEARAEE
jgi:hypothetical protein